MADHLTVEQRSWNMSRIHSGDTKPELALRSILHRNGFRFRLHRKDLPGKPDIVLPKYHIVILVHGCFWHGHPACKRANIPKSNTEYWISKINRNMARDRENEERLTDLGWNVIRIWECEIRNTEEVMARIREKLYVSNKAN